MLPEQSTGPVVLNAYQFDSLTDIRNAAANCSEPALLVVFPTQIEDVLTWLEDKDDVCLVDCPVELVEYRRQRLAEQMNVTINHQGC